MVNIWQVYFDEKSKANCYDWTRPWNNEVSLTEFFENSVIAKLIEIAIHKECSSYFNYFGVWSHDIKNEMVFKEGLNNLKLKFNRANLILAANTYGCDAYGFQKRRSNPNIIKQADRYHPGFIEIMEACLPEGYDIPNKLDPIILFNHFIARPQIYEDYYYELLKPAMAKLKEIPEAYNDAGYGKLNRKPSEGFKERFQKAFGKPHYPFHPFICERLPSLFMMKHKINFKHIF